MQCALCESVTAVTQYDLRPPLAEPAAFSLCLPHLRMLVRNRASKALRDAKALARTLCARCGAPGLLYPSGTWCREHRVGDSPIQLSGRSFVLAPFQGPEILPPILTATVCHPSKLPASVKSMLKALDAADWDADPVSFAVAGDGLESVLLRARLDHHQIACRWERRPGVDKKGRPYPTGFAKGFYRDTRSGWPVELGFTAALDCVKSGTFPDERASLLTAIRACMDGLGADIFSVEVHE